MLNDRYGAAFAAALKLVLAYEGGYVNDPRDLGGETNKGITQRTYDSFRLSQQLPKLTVKNITNAEVANIYYNQYWLAAGCNLMDTKLALFVFDSAVNLGLTKVISYFQEIVGTKEKTINAKMINDINYYIKKHSLEDLLFALLARRRASYVTFATKGSQRVFLQGWLNRLTHLESTIKEIA